MPNLKPALVAVMLFAALFSCKTRTGEVALRSSGDITVNGPGFDGSVHEGTRVLYTLKNVQENQNYTLRTEIALTSSGSLTADGTLTADIYLSADAFRNDPASPLKSAAALPAPNSNIYEVNFDAASSGDYVVVLSGKSDSVPGIQFFYNLRLMSAAVLTNFASSVISPDSPTAYDAQLVNPLNPGFLNIYNGGTITPSGVYSITLASNATATLANPQMFVYGDSSLTLTSLMMSSIPTTTQFVITRFTAGVPDEEHAEHRDTDVITDLTFTSGAEGPFIVLKGFVSAVTYTLSIGP